MTDRDAFMQTIIEHPQDNHARLVFADWLEEHDDPERAEFIRLQVELAKRPLSSELPRPGELMHRCSGCGYYRQPSYQGPCFARLKTRADKLLEKNYLNYVPKIAAGVFPRFVFTRGFVSQITSLDYRSWQVIGDETCRQTPIESVRLTDRPQIMTDWESAAFSLLIPGTGRRDITITLKNAVPKIGELFSMAFDRVTNCLLAARWPRITFEMPPIATHGGVWGESLLQPFYGVWRNSQPN